MSFFSFPSRPLARLILACALASLAPCPGSAGTLIALDFESPTPSGIVATPAAGTIDTFMGEPGRALVSDADTGVLSTERIRLSNTESDPAKLTVGFDLHVSAPAPVRVTLASFDADGRRTGARTALVVPPVAGSYYRFGIDLDKTEKLDGAFDVLAPFVEFTFAAESSAGSAFRIDNLSYTAPSFYVSPTGSDSADGRTAATAFATPQRAADAAGPGDVILLMDGTYVSPGDPDIGDVPAEIVNSPLWRPWWVEKTGGNVTFRHAGKPAAWIVFRSHPGHRPVLFNAEGWHGVRFGLTAAYVEVRGLVIQGNAPRLDLAEATADAARDTQDGLLHHGSARFNANGILADGRAEKGSGPRPHHLRIIDNTLFDHSGAGVTLIGIEYVTIEGNLSHDNCHFMRYGSSGLSTLLTWNWDAGTGHKIFFVRNVSRGNRTDVPYCVIELDADGKRLPRRLTDKFSDGNGIIVDVNQNNAKSTHVAYPPYHARTLVQNNLVYDNGGSGIHTVNSDHVDILHNTAYLNSASPRLEYSQIYTYASDDVLIAHNILVAPVADLAAGEKPEPVNLVKGRNGAVTFAHNLYFGGNLPPALGVGDRVADPLFLNPSRDPAVADFRLRPDSPARGSAARSGGHAPLDNLTGALRPAVRAVDLGAY